MVHDLVQFQPSFVERPEEKIVNGLERPVGLTMGSNGGHCELVVAFPSGGNDLVHELWKVCIPGGVMLAQGCPHPVLEQVEDFPVVVGLVEDRMLGIDQK